jgi:hypothetical protein
LFILLNDFLIEKYKLQYIILYMKQVTINIGDEDLKDIADIFKNEADFKPQARQDLLIIEILRQVLNNPKMEINATIDL